VDEEKKNALEQKEKRKRDAIKKKKKSKKSTFKEKVQLVLVLIFVDCMQDIAEPPRLPQYFRAN
jgi:hypothetical protein